MPSTCLQSIKTPLTIFITVIFLIDELYKAVYQLVRTDVSVSHEPLPVKEIFMITFAIMSLIGIVSNRKAFIAFTFLFMVFSMVLSVFNLFDSVWSLITVWPDTCQIVREDLMMNDKGCMIFVLILVILAMATMILTSLATFLVYQGLTSKSAPITDQRYLATERRFQSEPKLLRCTPIVSPKISQLLVRDLEAGQKKSSECETDITV